MRGWAVLLALTVLVTAAGFVGGRALGRKQSETNGFDLQAASYEAQPFPAARTAAGFSGFEPGSGLDGGVLVTGTVISASDGAIVLETKAGNESIKITGTRSLRHLKAATLSDLSPGAKVVVLPGANADEAGAILIVAPE